MNKAFKRIGTIVFWFFLTLSVSISVFAEYDVTNPNYYGSYYLNGDTNSPSYINVNSERILLNAYYVDERKCYLRGTSRNGYLTNSKFGATFSRISKCDESGMFLGEDDYVTNFVATGYVKIEGWLLNPLDKININSYNNGCVFTLDT